MNIQQAILVATMIVAIAACNHSDNDDIASPTSPPTTFTNLQVIHLGADAPAVNITADGGNLVEALDFAMTSGNLNVAARSYNIGVDARLADMSTANVLSTNMTLEDDTHYIVAAVGSVNNDTLNLKVIENPITDIASGYARVQVLHATEGAPTVDIYVSAPGDDIAVLTPTVTAGYLDATGQMELTAGTYQIRITATGDKTVLFDTEVELTADFDYFLAAVPNIYRGDSPVVLNAHVAGTSLKLFDKMAMAGVRAVHAVADAPEVDIIVNNSIKAFNNVPFKAVSAYAELAAGEYTLDVAATSDNSILALDDVPLKVENGMSYTVLATGSFTNNDIAAVLVSDKGRTRATAAILNIIHASYSAGNADIYLTPSMDISEASPALADVPFRAQSGFIEVNAGEYYVTVTPTGTKTAAIGPLMITLQANMRYSIAAVDGAVANTFDVITFDDFNN
ncbi:DUF4397 domain-containing protein [Paraferrimonas sp. SM1919]|uniref:DUF4397 domain-containing protein n=1 Tax=Paraferrimonas sp. SM1919 TaxID=2662263 RepID=UPI0013D4AA71|nr:DUF4397 domain-containing protein [Paraferrimonas sp. SM1919]